MVPLLHHPTVGSEETIVNLVNVDMFVFSLCCLSFVPFLSLGLTCINPHLTKVPSIFSTSITLNSVQEHCSFLSLGSLLIAMMTTCVFHPGLNWFCFILCKLPSWFHCLVYFHIATVCIALLMRISVIFKE